MSSHAQGRVTGSAAEIYEQFFVPALFADWPARLLRAADVEPGHVVLDIACGTGVLARAAREVVGDVGQVVGVDINEAMLAVARQKSEAVSWQQGAAESLPFATDAFDRVLSQFGLMFFADPVGAIDEMLRVARPGATVAVAVWASLESTPGYAAVARMLEELFGPEIASSIEVPYRLGDIGVLESLFESAGAQRFSIRTLAGKARFSSVDAWIYTDIKGWTLSDALDETAYEALRRAAPQRLSAYVCPDGSVEFASPAHIVTVTL